MKKISDEQLRNLVLGKKVDFKETRLLRQEENRKSERPAEEDTEPDHPLIAQGKAVAEIVAVLGENLIAQNKILADIVNDEVDTIKAIQATTPVKRKSWKLKVHRNAEGFTESLEIDPVDDDSK